ncbi:hypothetical protein [Cellulomonas carbonis]|uniref:Uncharacterized protein n=1 Tax=Cellulomonas carbonis T26 TaxID=947969 RepID=A0A0A0BQJ4_9CELL|nr:hypothetical protein [Cellulomonas carbonis]KGM09942.1 hypothetical protein N868_17610 [Cellulomonas carbonis T26]GGC10302.1 hypothetical protein GCM10010972_24490 [Cellulomonas carbonis]
MDDDAAGAVSQELPAGPTGSRADAAGRRPRRTLVGTAALAVVVVGWLALGFSPRLAPGPFSATPAGWETDTTASGGLPGEEAWRFIDPGPDGASFTVSWTNTGLFPVRVSAVADQSLVVRTELVRAERWTSVPPPRDPDGAPHDVVVIAPGEAVAVSATIAIPCVHMTAGSALGVSAVVLEAGSLGLHRRVELELPATMWLESSTDRTCDDGGAGLSEPGR